ncbi:hypothetical protein GQ53DRAFT_728038 [Thozetella sp. PMI_491]|nr:hypothetical protein GQ53DRAFT_728038 [Thozetella sp. PMI_491]
MVTMGDRFTFLTLTGPDLGTANTKEMRAHVTRVNFAKRRQRMAAASNQGDMESERAIQKRKSIPKMPARPQLPKYRSPSRHELERDTWGSPLYRAPQERGQMAIQHLFRSFCLLLDTPASGTPMLIRERGWVQLNLAEPALLEASLALASVYRGFSDPTAVINANMHRARAIGIINSRLNDPVAAVTDGVLGAVFTLAYCERLEKRDKEYQVHMLGFGRMIQLRKERSNTNASLSWFSDLLVSQVTPAPMTSSNRASDMSHLFLPDSALHIIDTISKDLAGLRTVLEFSLSHSTTDEFLIKDINQRVLMVKERADMLRGQLRYTDALVLALHMFLHLSCDHHSTPPAQLGAMANDLKDALSEPDTRLCTSIEFTAWQLMVGCVATTELQARNWFKITLWRLSKAMRLNEWSQVENILDKTFMPYSKLLGRFATAWEEAVETYKCHA